MISETPVPGSLFETFLSENPSYRSGEEGNFPGADSAVTGVSWFAANAFCQWLTKQLPASLAAWKVRLPTEAEWEYAVKSNTGIKTAGWEWCADPFAPLSFINVSLQNAEKIGSPERSIRGYLPGSINIEDRTSLPPEFASPFVSFRPVIAEK
jgi:formylglycine-generating enzyme required for sulfatase activity